MSGDFHPPTSEPIHITKRLVAQLIVIGVALVFGVIFSMVWSSNGPILAALAFTIIMGIFATLDATGHEKASTVLALGLGAAIVATEVSRKRSERR